MSESEEVKTPIDVENEADGQTRREFVGKLVTAAGAAAIAGLMAGAAGESAQADVYKGPTDVLKIPGLRQATAVDKDYYVSVDKHMPTSIQTLKLKGPEGFRVVVSGQEVGLALQQMGLLRPGVNLDNAKITIEFST